MDENFNLSEVIDCIKEGKDAKEILDQFNYPAAEYKKSSYQSKLTCAVIWLNREDVLREILKRGWSLTEREPGPLHTACALGKTEVVSLLLKHIAKEDVNYDGQAFEYDMENLKEMQGFQIYESPLYFALAHDDLDLLKILLPFFQVDEYNVTSLHYCCIQGAVKCAKYLLDSGHSPFDTVRLCDAVSGCRNLAKVWLSERRPLEIAIHTSVPLTKLLLEYEPINQVQYLYPPDCDMLIHNVIKSNDDHSPVKWKSGVMPKVVKLLIDRGVPVNGEYQEKTLIRFFFFHISNYYSTVYAKGSFSNLETFFNELLESAEMLKQAGLDSTRLDIFNSFSPVIRIGPVVLDYMFFQIGEPHTKYMSEALSGGVDLLFALWPNKTRQDGDVTFAILTAVLDALPHFDSKLTRHSGENHESFYLTVHSVLVKIFLDFPDIIRDGDLIASATLQRFIGSKYAKGDLLLLLLNFISTRWIHLLTVPKDFLAQRMTLKNISRFAVIRYLSVPKTEKVLQLPIPELLKTYLLFEYEIHVNYP